MRYLFILVSLLNITFTSNAQETNEPNEKKSNISLGLQMSSFGGDFGWGLHLTTPFLLKNE